MLDVGAFAAALEYATGKAATLVGKPSPEFFAAALKSLAAAPGPRPPSSATTSSATWPGLRRLGLRGILVRTGKHRPEELERSPIRPDAVLGSIAELPGLL